VVSSGAVICLLIITVAVSEKSRKLLGFLRKCVPPCLPLLDRHLQRSALNFHDTQSLMLSPVFPCTPLQHRLERVCTLVELVSMHACLAPFGD
jgi:hypothetical protein